MNFDGLSQLEKCGGLYVGSVTSPITFPAKEGVTVNLPAFKMSGEVVLNSPSLKSISCAKLESTGALFIASNALTELNMTALKEVAGDLSVQNSPNAANSVLTELSFPQLTSIGGALTMHYFSGLTKLNLTKLNYLGGGMDIALNASLLEEVNFPELVVANGVVSIERAPGLKKIALPKVKKITSFIFNKSSYGSYPLIKLDLSSLEEIADELYIRGIPMERLSLPKLTTIGGDCTLWDLQSVTNIEIPALTKMAGKLYFYSLNMLVTLDLSKLTELGSVELVGCLKLAKIKSPKVITSIELNLASNATCPVTEFEGLERVTGEMSLSNASGTSLVSIPHVKHIGQFSLNYTGKNAILTLPDVQTMETLDVSASDLVELTAPKLTAVTTKFKLSYCSALLTINIPELRTVGDFILMEHNAWSTNKARMTHINAFNGITSAKSVDISYCGKLVDFSGLSAVVSALATDKWSVSNCAYNPTLQDMRDGHYVKQ
ncbi:MAG: leucine-rich repeat protein [Alistipes sp.]